MKRWLGCVLLLLCTAICGAQDGKLVAVTSEKDAEIRSEDVAAARTVALATAARDAVERAYGTYIKVEQLPDARRIFAEAAAGLRYQILAEQRRGNRYWVKIQAMVRVPDQYAGSEVEDREELGETMKNFVQKYPQGEINWGDGIILAYGKGQITESTAADAQAKARRAAELDAKAHMLEMINDVPLDERVRIGEEPRMSYALEGFIQGAEVVTESKSGTTIQVTVQAPIRGVKGLAMTVYGYYTPAPPAVAQEIQPAPLPAAETFTGVVIDARKVAVNPGLFPKIKDTQKREVHTASLVNREDLQKRGMASYAVVAPEADITRLFPHARVIAVRYEPQTNPSTSSRKRRQGYRPLVVNAVGAEGTLKANLIVSDEDAAKLKAVDQKTGALKQCRVVVVVSSEIGGVEGNRKDEGGRMKWSAIAKF